MFNITNTQRDVTRKEDFHTSNMQLTALWYRVTWFDMRANLYLKTGYQIVRSVVKWFETRLNYCDYSGGDVDGVAGQSSATPFRYKVALLLTAPLPASTHPKRNSFTGF
jgi:hypothetical protein